MIYFFCLFFSEKDFRMLSIAVVTDALTFTTLGIFSRWQIDDIFLTFQRKTGFDISCKMSTYETFYMNSQSLSSRINEKNISNCHLQNFLPNILSLIGKSLLLYNKFLMYHLKVYQTEPIFFWER